MPRYSADHPSSIRSGHLLEADLAVYRRKKAIELVECGWSVKGACEEAEIPRSQYYRYIAKYRENGDAGLDGCRSNPHNRTPERVTDSIFNIAIMSFRDRPEFVTAAIVSLGNKITLQTVRKILKSDKRSKIGTQDHYFDQSPVSSDAQVSSKFHRRKIGVIYETPSLGPRVFRGEVYLFGAYSLIKWKRLPFGPERFIMEMHHKDAAQLLEWGFLGPYGWSIDTDGEKSANC